MDNVASMTCGLTRTHIRFPHRWLGHTLVGTTDAPSAAETRPTAPEDEVQWLLNECSRYLSPDVRVSRKDVLSAWRGWRPLARDPHAAPGAPASRDHVISRDPSTNVVFAPFCVEINQWSAPSSRRWRGADAGRSTHRPRAGNGRRGGRCLKSSSTRSASILKTRSRVRPPRSASWVEMGGSRR